MLVEVLKVSNFRFRMKCAENRTTKETEPGAIPFCYHCVIVLKLFSRCNWEAGYGRGPLCCTLGGSSAGSDEWSVWGCSTYGYILFCYAHSVHASWGEIPCKCRKFYKQAGVTSGTIVSLLSISKRCFLNKNKVFPVFKIDEKGKNRFEGKWQSVFCVRAQNFHNV